MLGGGLFLVPGGELDVYPAVVGRELLVELICRVPTEAVKILEKAGYVDKDVDEFVLWSLGGLGPWDGLPGWFGQRGPLPGAACGDCLLRNTLDCLLPWRSLRCRNGGTYQVYPRVYE